MKPLVMVSSVVREFEAAREAARRGIEDGGGDPLLVNEDFPAMGVSPRNACLDAVDSSDVYIVIIGARAGYVAPSGKTVVEEEYERAIARGLPILAFVQEAVEREPAAQQFEQRVSGYVGGHFRSSFTDYDGLRRKVAAATRDVAAQLRSPTMDPTRIDDALRQAAHEQRTAVLRTAFSPVRDEEVVDTVEIGRDAFREQIVALGMAKEVGLLSAWNGKESQLHGDTLTIRQEPGNTPALRYARIDLNPSGMLVLESNVSDRQAVGHGWGMHGLQILEPDVVEVLIQHFAFAGRLYHLVDRYQRQQAVHYNCALVGAGHRALAKEPARGGSVSMSMRGDQPIIIHPQPRQIGRAVLSDPGSEINRLLELLRRRMQG